MTGTMKILSVRRTYIRTLDGKWTWKVYFFKHNQMFHFAEMQSREPLGSYDAALHDMSDTLEVFVGFVDLEFI